MRQPEEPIPVLRKIRKRTETPEDRAQRLRRGMEDLKQRQDERAYGGLLGGSKAQIVEDKSGTPRPMRYLREQ